MPAPRRPDKEQIQSEVAAIVSKQIGFDIAVKAPLMEAGLDSLGAIELRTALNSSFGLELPATAIFDHPSIAALASFIASISHTEVTRQVPLAKYGSRHPLGLFNVLRESLPQRCSGRYVGSILPPLHNYSFRLYSECCMIAMCTPLYKLQYQHRRESLFLNTKLHILPPNP